MDETISRVLSEYGIVGGIILVCVVFVWKAGRWFAGSVWPQGVLWGDRILTHLIDSGRKRDESIAQIYRAMVEHESSDASRHTVVLQRMAELAEQNRHSHRDGMQTLTMQIQEKIEDEHRHLRHELRPDLDSGDVGEAPKSDR